MLKKNRACLWDHEDRNHDATDVLQRLRLCFEESEKKREKLQSELKDALKDVEKKEKAILENYQLPERMEVKNNDLRENLIT